MSVPTSNVEVGTQIPCPNRGWDWAILIGGWDNFLSPCSEPSIRHCPNLSQPFSIDMKRIYIEHRNQGVASAPTNLPKVFVGGWGWDSGSVIHSLPHTASGDSDVESGGVNSACSEGSV